MSGVVTVGAAPESRRISGISIAMGSSACLERLFPERVLQRENGAAANDTVRYFSVMKLRTQIFVRKKSRHH